MFSGFVKWDIWGSLLRRNQTFPKHSQSWSSTEAPVDPPAGYFHMEGKRFFWPRFLHTREVPGVSVDKYPCGGLGMVSVLIAIKQERLESCFCPQVPHGVLLVLYQKTRKRYREKCYMFQYELVQ